MDQDDTFRKLRQRPYGEVRRSIDQIPAELENYDEIYRETFEDAGWTRDEWLSAMIENFWFRCGKD